MSAGAPIPTAADGSAAGDRASSADPAGGFPLRRLDWRFLLPAPAVGPLDEVVLLGGPAGMDTRLIEEGFARRVLRELPTSPRADAVVALVGARTSAAALVAALRPGAVLYWEIDRRHAGSITASPGRIRRDLVAAGATVSGTYSALPDLPRCRAYVPLEAAGALPWFVRTLFPASSPIRRIMEKGVLLAGRRFRTSLGRFAPAFVVTAVRGDRDRLPPALLSAAEPLLRSSAADLYPLVLADDGNRLAMLPFPVAGEEPIAVLKVPKLAAFNDRTVNESEMLARLRGMLDVELRSDIPEPLGRVRHGPLEVAVERFLGGESLDRATGRWGASIAGKIEDLHRAADWLARFHAQVLIAREPWDHERARRWLDEPLRAYEEALGLTAAEERLAERARAYGRTLSRMEFPLTWVHRDYNVWNVFRSAENVRVIDWEGCRPGPVACDLLHFTAPWFEIAHRLQTLETQVGGFDVLYFRPPGGDPARQAVRTAVGRYLHRLDVDARLLPLLLLYTWVELALRRADQQRLQLQSRADPRHGNRFVRFVGVLAQRADRLFAAGGGFAAEFLGPR